MHSWTGSIVRVAAAIDRKSRQLFAVAHVDDPYKRNPDGSPPLRIGLFVEAEITGRRLENVFVIPDGAVRPNNEVILIDEESRIERRVVRPIWRDEDSIIVPAGEAGGLERGEVLCLTLIAFPADGAKVLATIDGVAPAEAPKGPPRGAGRGLKPN